MDSSRIDQLKALLADDPSDPQTLFLLGYEYNKARQHAEALEALLRCVEIQPSNAAGWKQLGDAYRRLDRLAEALQAYERGAAAGKHVGNEHTARECETLASRLRAKDRLGG